MATKIFSSFYYSAIKPLVVHGSTNFKSKKSRPCCPCFRCRQNAWLKPASDYAAQMMQDIFNKEMDKLS